MRPRSLKVLLRTAAAVLLLALTLAGAVLIGGNTDAGRSLIERLTERLTGGQVRLSGLQGSFPAQLRLAGLQLSDARGVWLTAENLSVRWTPSALLARRIRVESLEVAHVRFDRLPVAAPDSGGTPSMPHIEVAQASIRVVDLGPELAGAAAALSLHGDMEMYSLENARLDFSAQRIDGPGTYELHLRFDPARMDATLRLQEPAGGPLENILHLPGLGALSATLSLQGPRRLDRAELLVDAGNLHGRAQGTIDWVGRAADLEYAFDATSMRPRPDLAWSAVALRGRWHGPLSAPLADASLQVRQLEMPGGWAIGNLDADIGARAGSLGVRTRVLQLTIPGARPQLLANDPIAIDATLQLDQATRPLHLAAATRLMSLDADAVTAGSQRASLTLRLTDLAALAALTQVDLHGRALVKAELQRDAQGLRVAADATTALVAGAPPAGAATWLAALGNRPTLRLHGSLNDHAFVLDDLEVAGRTVDLSAGGSAVRSASGAIDRLRVQWALKLSDLGAWSPGLAGTFAASGELAGPATALALQASMSSTLSVHGSPPGRIDGALRARDLSGEPTGTLYLHGALDEAPVALDVALERVRGGSWRAQIRQGDWKSAHIHGGISTGATLASTRGELRLQVAQVGDLDRLLGIQATGSLDATMAFTTENGQNHARFRANAHALSAGKISGDIELAGDGVMNAVKIRLGARLPDLNGAPASAAAAAILNLETRKLRLTDFEVDYHGQALRLLAPAAVSFAGGVTVDQVLLGCQDARLRILGQVLPTLALKASLRDVGPQLANAFAPDLLAAGSLSGQADLTGSPTAPLGRVHVDVLGLRFASTSAIGLPALDAHATVQLRGDTANIDASLTAGAASHLTLGGEAPLDPAGTIALQIAGRLDVGLISPLLEARGLRAAGQIDVDARVAGTPAAPDIGGAIALSKGSLRDYGRGVGLTDITARISGSQAALSIDSFSARAAPGSVSMSGSIGLLQPGLPVDLKIGAKNAEPIASSLVTANLDADIAVTGTARARLDVAGTIHVNRANFGIPGSLPPNVAVLDVRRRGQKEPVPGAAPLVVGLNLSVHAPNEILVQGRGLDAELGGDLQVGGTAADPRVIGRFDLQRGSFSIAGKSLTLAQGGHVSFDGANAKNRLDPTLDFTAQAVQPGATATLRITGLADLPRFELSSVPALEPDAIMAVLLFGSPSVATLSALEVAQIGAALAVLSGVGGDGGLNPLVRLQRTLGLDRLSVASNATTAAPAAPGTPNPGYNVAAGRRVSRRVYVEAKQSTTGSTQVQVDVDLTKHLKLQTRLGNGTAITQGTTPENDPGSSLGLSYQIEY